MYLFPIGKVVVVGHKVRQFDEAIYGLFTDLINSFDADLESRSSITHRQLKGVAQADFRISPVFAGSHAHREDVGAITDLVLSAVALLNRPGEQASHLILFLVILRQT